ncbi:MAG: PHP domain-containing protein [Propionibacteriaceae bacterium]|jgi:predicted metal-dependent phosphoesterase TrpH|nr:PHP domain-containing protein [Propionibacteriaceae bacterium]
MRIDLHTHSSISDGTDSPAELVRHAAALGLDVVALTDHDSLAGLSAARMEARALRDAVNLAAGDSTDHLVGDSTDQLVMPRPISVLGGVELSTELEGRSVHLLGLGVRDEPGPLDDAMRSIRESRDGRVGKMAAALTALGMPVEAAEIYIQAEDATTVGRPHVADVMVAKGYVSDRREAFDKWLYDDGPAYVPHLRCPLLKGIELIHQAGGVALIAHPWGRSARDVLTKAMLADLVLQRGLDGFEVDHRDHDATDRAELHALAVRVGAIGTGSSDYHGSGKIKHDLGCNTTTVASLDEVLARIARRGGVGLG